MAVTYRPEPYLDKGTSRVEPQREEEYAAVGDNTSTEKTESRDLSQEDRATGVDEGTGRVEPTRIETFYDGLLRSEDDDIDDSEGSETDSTRRRAKARKPVSNKAVKAPEDTKSDEE